MTATILLLYGLGLLLLLGDFFLPSHGVLTLASFALLGYAVYLTFQVNTNAALLSMLALVIFVPSMLYFAVKTWHRTPIGRMISPPNPVLSDADRLPVEELRAVLGMRGEAITTLRPVGVCQFEERRLECVAESGMIPAGARVEAVRLSDRSVVVRLADSMMA